MGERYWLVVRDKPGLLVAMMRALAGNAHISFEGDLSRCRGLSMLPGASTEQTALLHRHTLVPRQDFVVLPLEPGTVRPLLDEVLPDGRVAHDIIHTQIEKAGELQFAAYDNFHRDCVVCWDGVPPGLLEQLYTKGVLRSWESAVAEVHRWHD